MAVGAVLLGAEIVEDLLGSVQLENRASVERAVAVLIGPPPFLGLFAPPERVVPYRLPDWSASRPADG